jgi:hypothetical protein
MRSRTKELTQHVHEASRFFYLFYIETGFLLEFTYEMCSKHFGQVAERFGITAQENGVIAAGVTLHYLSDTA